MYIISLYIYFMQVGISALQIIKYGIIRRKTAVYFMEHTIMEHFTCIIQ